MSWTRAEWNADPASSRHSSQHRAKRERGWRRWPRESLALFFASLSMRESLRESPLILLPLLPRTLAPSLPPSHPRSLPSLAPSLPSFPPLLPHPTARSRGCRASSFPTTALATYPLGNRCLSDTSQPGLACNPVSKQEQKKCMPPLSLLADVATMVVSLSKCHQLLYLSEDLDIGVPC